MQHSSGIGALVEFSYVSKAAPGMPPAVTLRLAQQAWSFNTRMGITGALRFSDGRFAQTIEGPSETVLALASRILTDRRHQEIEVTSLRAVAARRYADWTATGIAIEDAGDSVFAAARHPRALPAASTPCIVAPAALGLSAAP